MGNSNSETDNAELYSVLKPIKWEKQHWLSNTELVRSLDTNLKGQMHSIPIENIQSEIPIYQFRKDNPQYLVTVYSVEEGRQQILCAGGDFVKVVTQRIPFRLSDLGNVGYAEGLYILQCILKGAKIIDERYLSASKGPKSEQCSQYVHYTDEMVCFTESGEAKIWVSQNLASNHPPQIPFQNFQAQKQQNILQTFNIEKKIVLQLFSLIQSRMSGNKFLNYLQVKRQQQQQLIDFQNCIDFILRIRALEENQNESIKNIILPSMLVKSMPSNSQYDSYTNRSEDNDEASNRAKLDPQAHVFKDRVNGNSTGEGYGKMESSVSSTNSQQYQDINKFAVPPRPPRKNSKSKSKQKPSRNGSPSKPLAKPNISQPNSAQSNIVVTILPQPPPHTIPPHQIGQPIKNISVVASPAANPRAPNMVKKQSLSHPRSPFQQISQSTPAICINGVSQIPAYQPVHQQISPKNAQKLPQFVPINGNESSHFPATENSAPQLYKKSSNSSNTNTNTQPTYHPIQWAISNKLSTVPASTHTHNSPPHASINSVIRFNTNSHSQPYWIPSISKQPNTDTKPVKTTLTSPMSNNNATTTAPINTAPGPGQALNKQSSQSSSKANESNTNANTNTNTNTNINTNTNSSINSNNNHLGQLHNKFNKYSNMPIDITNKTIPNSMSTSPYNQYGMGQYQQPHGLYRNQSTTTNPKINITFNNTTVPTYTHRNTTTNPFQYNPSSHNVNTNQHYNSQYTTPMEAYYPNSTASFPTHTAAEINTKCDQNDTNFHNKTEFKPINTHISPYPSTSTKTNPNRSIEKISLKASRTNIELSPKLDARQRTQAQYNKTIQQRVHNVINRQLLADTLQPNPATNPNKRTSPTKLSNATKTNTTSNTNNITSNIGELGISKTANTDIEGSIQEI